MGNSGLPRALIIILDVANSLRMSVGAILVRTSSQSVLVHRTAPVMVLMVLFIQLYVGEIGVCIIPPNWSIVLSHRVAEGQV